MNNTLETKLAVISKLYKFTNKSLLSNGFIIPTDYSNTWTNGYIADMGGVNFEQMSIEAKLLHLKAKPGSSMRYCIENGPQLKQIIPTVDGQIVTDIYTDFGTDTMVCLKSQLTIANNEPIVEDMEVWANGSYISYFKKTYPTCQFYLTAPLQPILVKVSGELVGLIMPIRHE